MSQDAGDISLSRLSARNSVTLPSARGPGTGGGAPTPGHTARAARTADCYETSESQYCHL